MARGKAENDENKLRRSAARLSAVQALYQMELTGGALKPTEDEF
ncbi:MAG: N utilization substance protein B, partial [Rhodobacterales bacterium]|nr:N utilization substance protein B [Rhodobacterales bacterium]